MKRRTFVGICASGLASVAGCAEFASPQSDSGDGPSESAPQSCGASGGVSLTAESREFVDVADNNEVETHVFTLQNETECALEIDVAEWVIEEETADSWKQVEAGDGGENRTIESGAEHQWSLSRSPHPTPDSDTTTFVVADLAEGTYRFSIAGTRTDGKTVTAQAQFELLTRTESTSSSET